MLRVTLRNGSVGALKTTQGNVFRSSSGYLQKCGGTRFRVPAEDSREDMTQGSVLRSSSGYLQRCGGKRKVKGTV